MRTLEQDLINIRTQLKKKCDERKVLKAVENPSSFQQVEIDLLRKSINKLRKKEKFLMLRIKGET